jgi:hypothetical protein
LTGPAQYLIHQRTPLLGRILGIPQPPTGGSIAVPNGLRDASHRLARFHRYQALAASAYAWFALSLKHIFWINCLCREKVTLQFVTFAVLSDFF